MCKSQRAKMFRGFAPNSIGTLQSKPPNPPAPKLRNSQFGPNGPNWKFVAHTLVTCNIFSSFRASSEILCVDATFAQEW